MWIYTFLICIDEFSFTISVYLQWWDDEQIWNLLNGSEMSKKICAEDMKDMRWNTGDDNWLFRKLADYQNGHRQFVYSRKLYTVEQETVNVLGTGWAHAKRFFCFEKKRNVYSSQTRLEGHMGTFGTCSRRTLPSITVHMTIHRDKPVEMRCQRRASGWFRVQNCTTRMRGRELTYDKE